MTFLRLFSLVLLLPCACLAQADIHAYATHAQPPANEDVPHPEPSVTLDSQVAAQSAGAPQVLTLDEAVAMAERNNPRLRGAAAEVARSTAATQTARSYINPSIEIYEGHQSARPIATPAVPGLLQHYAAYQSIEIPAERRARRKIAELGSAGSKFSQQGVVRSVQADTKHAFYNVLRQREEVEHTRENLQLVEDLRRRVEVEVNVGERGRLELTRAEAEIAHARFALRKQRRADEPGNDHAVRRPELDLRPGPSGQRRNHHPGERPVSSRSQHHAA